MSIRIVLALVSVLAALLALAIVLVAARARRRTRFTMLRSGEGKVVASDTGVLAPVLLRDSVLGIRGVPDYIVEMVLDGHRRLVPVEVKPTRRSKRLYDSDRVQVGAYLLGLRATVGDRAAHVGYVRYSSESFPVVLTPELEADVRQIVAAIRLSRDSLSIHRSHGSRARCRGCAVRMHCDESLVR